MRKLFSNKLVMGTAFSMAAAMLCRGIDYVGQRPEYGNATAQAVHATLGSGVLITATVIFALVASACAAPLVRRMIFGPR